MCVLWTVSSRISSVLSVLLLQDGDEGVDVPISNDITGCIAENRPIHFPRHQEQYNDRETGTHRYFAEFRNLPRETYRR